MSSLLKMSSFGLECCGKPIKNYILYWDLIRCCFSLFWRHLCYFTCEKKSFDPQGKHFV